MTSRSLRARAERRLRNKLWAREPLRWTLRSGLDVLVANEAEWILYGEIFVDGEYDLAITRALEYAQAAPPFCVLDLGANVGFFTTRLIDVLLQRQGAELPFRSLMVEGSPACHDELRKRLLSNPLARNHVRIEHGLVGKRAGKATIYQHAFHAANSVNNQTMVREGKGTEVNYIDVASLAEDMPRVHLLKCDIEGSELTFLENYPDLLAKVDTVMIELHPELCDVGRCRDLLAASGLVRRTVIRTMPAQLVEFFERGRPGGQ